MTLSESEQEMLLAVDPLIPWPHDQVPDLVHTCHLRLSLLVERAGWEGALACPETRRFIKVLSQLKQET